MKQIDGANQRHSNEKHGIRSVSWKNSKLIYLMAKFTYTYKCEVKAFINCLAGNESFKSTLLQNVRTLIDVLEDPDCEAIRPKFA